MSDAERRIRGFARLEGVWRSHGYGTVLEIGGGRYRLHEETRVSCLPVFEGSLADLAEIWTDVRVSPGRRAFSVRRATGVTRVRYRRLAELPVRCTGEPVGHAGPERVFEVLWHTFAERYASFDLREVDWSQAHAAFRPRVDRRIGKRRLFATLCDLLRPLGDGHVTLRAPFATFSAGVPSRLHHGPVEERAARARDIVHERYLGGRVHRGGHGLLEWGRLDAETGYLSIRAMAGQSGASNRPRADQRAAADAMARALADLGSLPDLVVDVRRNPGGYDGVALRLAGHLTDRKRLAFTKVATKHEGHGPQQRVHVEPRGSVRYRGRIHLLTSELTASAAEIFVLALLRRPRLTRVGEPTAGELSDVMERHLPNGWTFTLSNELYRAADGELYEGRGIPPRVELPFLDPSDLEAGRDPALDRLIARSRARR